MHKFVLLTVVALFAVTFNVATAQSPETLSLLEKLEERGILTAADKNEILAETSAESTNQSIEARLDEMVATMNNVASVSSEYKPGKGVTFTSADGDFSLRLRGVIQARFSLSDIDLTAGTDGTVADDDTEMGFSVPRVRVVLEGHAFKDWGYRVQFDAAGGTPSVDGVSSSNRSTMLRDAQVTWQKHSQFKVSVGQFKAPYGRQYLTSFTRQQFTERSEIQSMLAPRRQIGIMAHGMAGGDNDDLVAYHFGIFNGEGQNAAGGTYGNFGGNDDEGFMYVGRVMISPMGYMKLTEGDTRPDTAARDLILQVAFNAFYDTNDTAGQEDPYGIGGDVAIFVEGMSAFVQFDYTEDALENEVYSILVQVGYFIVPSEFEIAGRFQYGELDNGTTTSDGYQIGAVVTYMIAGHNAKVQFDVLYTDLEAGIASEFGLSGEAEIVLVRLQIILLF